jgi:sigma-B regulation protein RsbU (phosphoserine phosphatase)
MRPLDTDTQGLMPQTTPRAARVLVVEDNEVAREGLAVVLGRAGYEVTLAADGEEALDLLRAGPAFHLILLDMLMPVLDGWGFLERLAREGTRARAPIVVATGSNLTPEWARDHGCQGFLQKPIDSGPLLGEVRRCLGQP